jgi:predicted lipid carrier protein YhbT/chorismate mutase
MKPFTVLALSGARQAIDQIDDAMIALLAGRRRLVGLAGRLKRNGGLPPRDFRRERRVHRRAQRLAACLGVPPECAAGLMTLLIAEASRQQAPLFSALASPANHPAPVTGTSMPPSNAGHHIAYYYLLRLIPPPRRWKQFLALLPATLQTTMVEKALSKALSSPLADRALEPIRNRRLGVEISDLGLYWVLELRDDRLQASHDQAEATVCGSAADLLLLASRLEDADTLFFQRKLTLTGDTELGLTARNLLDRLPWESVPLGLRIALHRGARLVRAARAAHRGDNESLDPLHS